MPARKLSDTDFITMFRELGPCAMERKTKQSKAAILSRRRKLEQRLGYEIPSPNPKNGPQQRAVNLYPQRQHLDIQNGEVLIGGDWHIWPGEISTAGRAFIKFAKKRRPRAVILNGDVMDFPQISKYVPAEDLPTLEEEMLAVQDTLHELEKACGKGVERLWTLGNHDARFETRLRTVAPEFAKLNGFHLKDHYPNWTPCWSVWINDEIVVKHRFKGGIHATHNNTIWAGKTIVTNHLHSAQVRPFTDYNGTRFGVDTGCLADPNGPQFTDYTEDNPKNWRAAFCVLTFIDGYLLTPELVIVWDENTVVFRGELINV